MYDDYDDFAAAYNRHWGLFASAVRPVLDRLALTELENGATVVDLCCGTGQLANSLSDRFDVIGIDGSASMIAFARNNAPKATFVVADARQFNPVVSADAVVSTFDSLNHVMSIGELEAVFRNVRATLGDDGVFVFDLNMEQGYEERWSSGSFETGHDAVEVVSSWDAARGIAKAAITVATAHDDGSTSSTEVMLMQRCYSEDQITATLRAAGFDGINVFDGDRDLDFGGVGRSFFVARS